MNYVQMKYLTFPNRIQGGLLGQAVFFMEVKHYRYYPAYAPARGKRSHCWYGYCKDYRLCKEP